MAATWGSPNGGVPWRKLSIALAILVVVGLVLGFGTADAIRKDEEDREAGYRTRCLPVPEGLAAAASAGLHELGDREVRAVGLSRAEAGERSGSWFLSLELASPTLARGSTGDIATFVVPDAGGAPAAAGFEAVGPDAVSFSTWPPAPPSIHVSHEGGIESRWCAKDAGPAE